MSHELAARLIDTIGAFLLFTMILILGAGRLYRAIYAVAAQSVFISLAGAVLGAATHNADLWVIAGITLVVKVIALPWLLFWVIRRIGIVRHSHPVVPIPVTLAVAGGIVVLAFHLSSSLGAVRQAITGNALPVGISLAHGRLGDDVAASSAHPDGGAVRFRKQHFAAVAVSQGMPLMMGWRHP
jgi:hydrogenase-4 membrane subunit HyfE